MPTRVSQAIGGFAQYLQGENIRLREEDRKQRINDAAEHISREFQGLGPDASLQEIAGLQYSLVNDAAQYGALQESLPLIQGFFQTALGMRQAGIEETQSGIISAGLEGLGYNIPEGATGQSAGLLAGVEGKTLQTAQGKNESGQQVSITMNPLTGEEISSIVVDRQTDQQRMQAELDLYGAKTNIDLQSFKVEQGIKFGYDKALLEYKVTSGLSRTGKWAQANGLERIKTHVGEDGRFLYEDAQGGVYQIFKDPATGELTHRIYNGKIQSPKSDLETQKITQGVIAEDEKDAGGFATSIMQDVINATDSDEKAMLKEIFKGTELSKLYNEGLGGQPSWSKSPRVVLEQLSDIKMQQLKEWAIQKGGAFDEEKKLLEPGNIYTAIDEFEQIQTRIDKLKGEYIPDVPEPYNPATELGGKFMQLSLKEPIMLDNPGNEMEKVIGSYFQTVLPTSDYSSGLTSLHYQMLTPKQKDKLHKMIYDAALATQEANRQREIQKFKFRSGLN